MFPSFYWPIFGTDADAGIIGDAAADWAFIDGIQTGIYQTLDAVEVAGVKARRGTLDASDFAGSDFAVSNRDVPWNIWNVTLGGYALAVNAKLYLQGTWWVIISIGGERQDGAQTRVIARKQRTA